MSKKRNYNPMESEAMLQKGREEKNFVGKTETAAMATIIETAKRNGRIGDKMLLVIPPYYVHIPDWQRDLDILKAEAIGYNYDKNRWEVPKVIYEEGKLFVVDGEHRMMGAFLGGIEAVVVEVLNITEEEAITLFLGQTRDKKKMKPCDYFKASIKVGKPEYIAFREICNKYHVQIKGDHSVKNPIGTFTSLTDGLSICRKNPETLDDILRLIMQLQWNQIGSDEGKAFSAKYIRVLKKLYAYYGDSTITMERALKKYCKGAEWFQKNAIDKTQQVLFDELSEIIAHGKLSSVVTA